MLVGVSAWQLTRLGADFLPQFDEGSVQVNVTCRRGSSLEASNEVVGVIDAKLRDDAEDAPRIPSGAILHFARRTGRAELDEHAEPVNVGEYILTMNPDVGRQPRRDPEAAARRPAATKCPASTSRPSSRCRTSSATCSPA